MLKHVLAQGGGYKEDMPSTRSSNTTADFTKKVQQLKKDRWLDRQTRAVFVEFTIYSLSVELAAVVQLWYEKNSAGVVRSFVQVMPIKMGHLKISQTGMTDLAAEGFMFCMLLFYTGVAIRQMYREGLRTYFGSIWNEMDVVNYMLFYGAFAMRYAAVLNGASITFPPKDTDFIYTSAVASQIVSYKYLMGFNSILTLVRIFKLLGHVPFMARLVNILSGSAEDVIAFLLCCMVLFIGFSGAFHLTYGTHLKEWATFAECFMSLYRMANGEWDYDGMVEYSPMGTFYFVIFSLLAICLLMNMFVAIIMEAYDAVKEEEEKITMTQVRFVLALLTYHTDTSVSKSSYVAYFQCYPAESLSTPPLLLPLALSLSGFDGCLTEERRMQFLLQRFGSKGDVDVVVQGEGKEQDGRFCISCAGASVSPDLTCPNLTSPDLI